MEAVQTDNEVLRIDSFRDFYFFLSNFYPAAVYYEEIRYPSSEHAFQAAKTKDIKIRKFIAASETAKQAKARGRAVRLRPNWDRIKFQVMYDICFNKFCSNASLLDRLLKTEGKELIEGNTWGDRIWGVDEYGVGENWLGKILMKIRDEIMQVYVGGRLVKRPVLYKLEGVKGPYEK